MVIRIFSSPNCGACVQLKHFLNNHNVSFEEIDITTNPDSITEIREVTQSISLPTMVISNGEEKEVIVGFRPRKLQELFCTV